MMDLKAKCDKASKDFDEYNTVSAVITVNCNGQSMDVEQVVSGEIKYNGSEIAKNIESLKSQSDESAVFTVREV